MKRRSDTINLLQWGISAGVLLIVVFATLIWFSNVGRAKEQAEVEAAMVQQMKVTALQVEKEFSAAVTYAETMAAAISQGTTDIRIILKMAEAAGHLRGIHDVILCEEDGTGYRLQGDSIVTVTVSEDIYLMSTYTDKESIIYLTEDDLHEQTSIVIVEPIGYADRKTQYLICYYNLPNLQWLVADRIFGSDVFFVLLSDTGASIMMIQNNNTWQNPMCQLSDDYLDFLEELTGETEAVENLHAGIWARGGGATYVYSPGNERYFAHAPMDFGNYTLVAAVGNTYVDRLVRDEWTSGHTVIMVLSIAFIVFLLLLVVIVIINLIRNSNKHKALEEKADTDLLTELYNKMSTERKIKEYMASHPNEQGLLFILDIDNFKKINDTMGHAFGDEVLRTLGTSIRSEFRASDILGRTGGDEFTLFLRNMKDDDIIKMEAEKVERFFQNFKAGTYTKYSVTASIGAAVFPRDGANFEDLYKAADSALYVAKKRGKNQLAFYGDEA